MLEVLFKKKNIKKVMKIDGMSCNHCKNKIEKGVNELKEVKKVTVDLENKTATIILKKELNNNMIKSTIEELGFSVIEE